MNFLSVKPKQILPAFIELARRTHPAEHWKLKHAPKGSTVKQMSDTVYEIEALQASGNPIARRAGRKIAGDLYLGETSPPSTRWGRFLETLFQKQH